ncbi:DinB family protein [Alteribacter aurantiacus]|uniref:DinB family protein n=1 Tax=Alteribacter aurantiacus TaxID=254410 RepID=UPI0004032042|nr:DinB family protein [Alteribacter aurantiacus]
MEKRHTILFNQLKSYREELLQLVEDVNEEEAEVIPRGFNNNIRWNLGHVYLDQHLWIQALTKEKNEEVDHYNHSFGFGTTPGYFTENTPSFALLKDRLKHQPDQILEEYGGRLAETFTPIEMGMETVEQVLIRTIFHEGMHTQAILDLKKVIRMERSDAL